MVAAVESDEGLRLGAWSVEPSLGRVRNGDVVERLEPRVMAVLIALSRTPGETVGREALIEKVWDGAAVSDDALQRCISILRRTLGRGEHGVRIETIPKVGYRLVVDEPTPPRAAPGPEQPADGLGARSRWVGIGMGVAVALAAIIGAIWPRPAPEPPVVIRPLTTTPGHEMNPSLSPDGAHVAYIGRDGGTQDLFVTVGRGQPLRLTDTDDREHSPAFSPDGTEIAFARTEDGRCAVYAVAATGGPPRRLFRCQHAARTEIAWSPDGARLAYVDRLSSSTPRAIRVIELGSGRIDGPPPPDRGPGDGDPAFAPDGQTLVFSRSPALGVEDLHRFTLKSGQLARLTVDNIKVHGLTFLSSRTVLFSSNRAGPFGLWTLDLGRGRIARVPAAGRHHDAPTAAAGVAVYEAWRAQVDIFALPASEGGWRLRPSGPPVVRSTHFDWHPDVNAAGQLAFVSDRSGAAEIWTSAADGGRAVQLTRFGGPYVQGPRWSPSGDRLVFAAPVDGDYDLFIVDAGGGRVRRLFEDPARDRTPAFSVDGRTVYYASDRSGGFRVWALDLRTGQRIDLFEGYAPRPVGEWLYYTKARQDGLYRRRGPQGAEAVVVADLTPVDARNWIAHGDHITFVERAVPARPRLAQLDFTTGTRTILGPLDRFHHHSGLALGPDGRLWLARVVSSETDLYRIEWADDDPIFQ